MLSSLDAFLLGPTRNVWTHDGPVHAYLRKSRRSTGDKTLNCLDIANLNVQPNKRRKGFFKTWYAEAEASALKHGLDAVYVESAMNPVVAAFCLKQGFVFHSGHKLAPNYIKKLA